MTVQIINADCREALKGLADASVDGCVTDPPYGISFQGAAWDHGVPGPDVWREVLRVLKPGAHLLSFAATRTYHRAACAIEDAGFEIRDQIGWAYANGHPKSFDLSKAMDKDARAVWVRENAELLKPLIPANSFHDWTVGGHAPSDKWWEEIKTKAGGGHLDRAVLEVLRKAPGWYSNKSEYAKTAPKSADAVQWQGWGTALKPAWEPICLARKPLVGPLVANVRAFQTGALNVASGLTADGRWPVNIIANEEGDVPREMSRLVYCARASKAERAGTDHPTIKPVALMQYLARLIIPQGGTLLDPFAGTGTAGIAAAREGMSAVLIEIDHTYASAARRRITADAPLLAAS